MFSHCSAGRDSASSHGLSSVSKDFKSAKIEVIQSPSAYICISQEELGLSFCACKA